MFKIIVWHVIFTIIYTSSSCSSFSCIHDNLILEEKPTMHSRNAKTYHEITKTREKDPTLFEPLEIFFYFDNVEQSLSTNAYINIKVAFEKIRIYVSETFQVRKRRRPFRLERLSCAQLWQFGKNRGKCSKYSGELETCTMKDVIFEIPEKFLDKLDVYEEDVKMPRFVAPAGPGLQHSNFIVFVTAVNSGDCNKDGVFACAIHCRINKLTNEPLAGVLNICPDYFKSKLYPVRHYYSALLHELFHIMGFSKYHFEKFLPCEKGMYCDIPRTSVVEDANGTFRMMFPHVIKSMQLHFGCDSPDFGGPMQKGEQENETYTSHWNPVMMYSSIMAPDFSDEDYVYVDNITLAVFASTGWYRVKFDNKASFTFGKGAGCDFGLADKCDSPFFCKLNETHTSCDMQHDGIAQCKQIDKFSTCGVFKPITMDGCQLQKQSEVGLSSYSMGLQYKCLLLEQAENPPTPICAPIKCETQEKYNVLFNLTWIMCADKEKPVTSNGTLVCAPGNLFCSEMKSFPVHQKCPENHMYFIAVKIYFRLPTFHTLKEQHGFKNFKVTTLRAVADKMNIHVNYIMNASLNVFQKIYLDFSICPPLDVEYAELNEMLESIQNFMSAGNFLEILKGPNDEVISSSDVKINPSDTLAFSDHEGFQTLLIFPIAGAIFVIVTVVSSLIRFFINRKDRPRRTVEPVEELELPNQTTAENS